MSNKLLACSIKYMQSKYRAFKIIDLASHLQQMRKMCTTHFQELS